VSPAGQAVDPESMSMKHFQRRYAMLAPWLSATLLSTCLTTATLHTRDAAAAAVPDRAIQVRPPGAVSTLPARAKRWALVIGVDQYVDQGITSLSGAANDAKAIADALQRYAGFPAEQVVLLTSDQREGKRPDRSTILNALYDLAETVPKDGLLFVSFSGHGIERSEKAYLLTSDARINSDIRRLEDTSISVELMRDRIRETGVKQVLLVLDACRNNPVAGRAVGRNTLSNAFTRGFNFDDRNREITAFATLYATAVGDSAYEYRDKKQGYFSWQLIEGLKGGAANAKGEVTLASLVEYVQIQVPKQVQSDLGMSMVQKPFADIHGYLADKLVIAVTSPKPNGGAAGLPAETIASSTSDLPQFGRTMIEEAVWNTIKDNGTSEQFKDYVANYPNSRSIEQARQRALIRPSGDANQNAPPPADLRQANASLVYHLGYLLGFAEVAALDDKAPAKILNDVLELARQAATVTKIPVTDIEAIKSAAANGQKGEKLYQQFLSLRQSLQARLATSAKCGRSLSLEKALMLGYQQGFIELYTYQDRASDYVQQVANLAVQYADGSGLPSANFRTISTRLKNGEKPAAQYQTAVNMRSELARLTNINCSY
jgi:hypothetical protein